MESPGEGRIGYEKISNTLTTNGVASEGWNEVWGIGGSLEVVGRHLGGEVGGGWWRSDTPRRDTLETNGLMVNPGPLNNSSSKLDHANIVKGGLRSLLMVVTRYLLYSYQ